MRTLKVCAAVLAGVLLAGVLAVVGSPPASAASAALEVTASLQGANRLPRSSTTHVEVTVESVGSETATGAVLELTNLGTTLTSYVVEQGPTVTCAGSPVVCDLGDLAAGTLLTIVFEFQLPATAGMFAFRPEVTAENAFAELLDFYPRVIGGGVDMSLSMTASVTVTRNTAFSVMASYENLNDDESLASTLTISLPAGVRYAGYEAPLGNAECTYAPGAVSCWTPYVSGAGGEFPTVPIELFFVAPDGIGLVPLEGVVTTSSPEVEFPDWNPVPGEQHSNNRDTSSILVRSGENDANIGTRIDTEPTQVDRGDVFDYTIWVRNFGPATATNLVISATLPADATFESAAFINGSGGCSYSAGSLTCTVPSLVGNYPSAETIVEIDVNLRAPTVLGPLHYSVIVDADQTDADLSDNTDDATTQVVDFATLVSIGDASGYEGDLGKPRTIKFPIRLSRAVDHPVYVQYHIVLGTASGGFAGDDIDSRGGVSRTIVFNPGRNGLTPMTKMVSVKVLPDGNPEADETFGVAVWHVQSVLPVAIRDGLAQGTVLNDDPGVGTRIGVGHVVVSEGDAGTGKAPVAITLSQPAVGGEQVTIATSDGSAAPGVDYRAKTRTITLKPGQRQVYFTVQILGNDLREGDRDIGIVLSGATGGASVQGTGVGTITIVDDD